MCEHGALSLVGGVSIYEGRVEMCGGDKEWGTVCDDSWSLANTRVVCRQLNFTNSAITRKMHFNLVRIFNSRVGCTHGIVVCMIML